MFAFLRALTGAMSAALSPRASLVAENLALRQQLAVLRRATPRPRSRPVDRAFWIVLSRALRRGASPLAELLAWVSSWRGGAEQASGGTIDPVDRSGRRRE
jgi:hypothetical protein